MGEPLLSVCLITHNHAKFIQQAIEGVLLQHVNFSWELIIADDFSTDGSREILEEYRCKHPDFIKLILRETKVGAAKNWEDLMLAPKSKYIAYFEGDDYWTDPSKLQKQVDFMESNADFSICFHNVIKQNLVTKCESFYHNENIKDVSDLSDLLVGVNYLPSCSVLYRRTAINFPSWIYELPFGDYALHIIAATSGKIKYFSEVMGVYRIHDSGSHGTMTNTDVGLVKAYTQHFRFWQILMTNDFLDRRKLIKPLVRALRLIIFYSIRCANLKAALRFNFILLRYSFPSELRAFLRNLLLIAKTWVKTLLSPGQLTVHDR